jgi:hypothetical protein
MLQGIACFEARQIPFVSRAVLSLDLMNFSSALLLQGELDTLTDRG